MKTYLQWRTGIIVANVSQVYRNGYLDGSLTAWEYRTKSFKIQERVLDGLRKELRRALSKGAKAVRANQLIKQRADRVERENRNLKVQCRVGIDARVAYLNERKANDEHH